MSERSYRINGEDKPSITSIVHLLGNPFLDQWKINQAIDYIRDRYDTISQANFDDILNEARVQHTVALEELAGWGTAVHSAMETSLRGKDIYMKDWSIRNVVEKGTTLLLENKCRVIALEEVVYDEGRAGTIDLLCEINEDIFLTKANKTGKMIVALIDFKTSKQYYDSHKIQLAGYLSCKHTENNLDTYMRKIKRVGIMRLDHTGRVNIKDFSDQMTKWSKVFNNLLEIHKTMRV